MITTLKNQSPFIIVLAVLGVMVLMLFLPTEAMLSCVIFDDFKVEYVNLTLKMLLVFLMGYFLIRRLKIKTLAGLSGHYPWRFRLLNFIPVYLIIIGFLGFISNDFSQIEPINLIILLMACLMVGFAEEYIFRGLFQALLLKADGSRQNGIFKSILFQAVIFGAFHLVNLINNDDVGQVLVQVVFAMFIGFFFGVLVLKTNKLIPLAITHGLINFFFLLPLLPGLNTVPDDVTNTISFAPIILTLPLFIIGLLIYRKLDEKEVINKLGIET